MANRLANATSPYLLQHAENPVDWWEWGPDAFAEAKRRDLPILLSIGYAACHWCHVMAHESFEDPHVAELVNQRFVAVKVDREEHPDVDQVHMAATQALTGRGGWPMTVFLTPAGAPFFAGTYFPPQPSHGSPSFSQVVETLGDAWRDRRDEVLSSAGSIVSELQRLGDFEAADSKPVISAVLETIRGDFDMIRGGFGGAPKFPAAMLIDALLVKGDPSSLDMAQRSCEAMARGGIHDQVGGGFHRYSVDNAWVVPHFEKMLYDNALLLGSYARCWRRTADHDVTLRALFEHVCYSLVDWLRAEMLVDDGAFAASLDADSCDIRGAVHEGIYYVWSPELLSDALGDEDAEWAQRVFHVHSQGNFEHGLSTLQLRGTPDRERLTRVLATLRTERSARFAPGRDDKVVAAWNGLLIDSLVQAAGIFAEPEWLAMAQEAAEYLWRVHRDGESWVRTSRAAVAGTSPAVCEDYAAMALGFARLAGATGRDEWLQRACQLLELAQRRFAAPDGGYFDAEASDLLYRRPRDVTDNATPSATATMTAALRLTGAMAQRTDFLERADRAATTTWGAVAGHPRFAGWSLADLLVSDEARRGLKPAECVVVLDDEASRHGQLATAAWRMAPAGTAVILGAEGSDGFGGLFTDRPASAGGTAYVCRGQTCFEPVNDYNELKSPLWHRM